MKKQTFFNYLLVGVLYSTILFVLIYFAVRVVLFVLAEQIWYEDLIAVLLLIAEIFIFIHAIGYVLEILMILYKKKSLETDLSIPELKTNPAVAVLIPSYKEPINILEDTLITCYNLSYENKHVFLLDDTRYDDENDLELMKYKQDIEELCKNIGVNLFRRKWRGAKAGIINDFIDFVEDKPKVGSNLQAFSSKSFEKPKYLVVFDADQNPYVDFLEPLLAKMEADETLAFIQTPQYYTNFQENKIARAAGFQQTIFYEYICEGKSLKNAMFCCGTNVIFNLKALLDVGGFDEDSVTEDFSTSFKFHIKNWKTAYYNKVSSFGMGPEDLGGYFKQQYRWALGTLELFKTIIVQFFKNPKKLSALAWFEYFLSGTHYLIGVIFLIFMISPVLYVFFRVPSYFVTIGLYGVIFFPYIILTMVSFFWTLRKRNYQSSELFFGQVLMLVSFPIFVKALVNVLRGKKSQFEVTTKGESKSLPLYVLWPQLLLGTISFSAVIWGLNRIYYERFLIIGVVLSSFWCLYNFAILTTVFYFNKSSKTKTDT